MSTAVWHALTDPDVEPPWDAVGAVVTRCPLDEYLCPICLEIPAVSRATQCGHVFCYACILRHFQQQKDVGTARTCPLCQCPAVPSELRAAVVEPTPQDDAVGTFVRAWRYAHRTVVWPHDTDAWPDDVPRFGTPAASFSRYCEGTREFFALVERRDLRELQEAYDALDDGPRPHEYDATKRLDALSEAIQFTQGTHPWQQRRQNTDALPTTATADAATATPTAKAYPTEAPTAAATTPPRLCLFISPWGPSFLSPLCVRMILDDDTARGATTSTVTAEVRAVDVIAQTDRTRACLRAFAHIPKGGVFRLCHVDLRNVVGAEVVEKFAAALRARAERTEERGDGGRNATDEAWEAHKRSAARLAAEMPPQEPEGLPPDAFLVALAEPPPAAVGGSKRPGQGALGSVGARWVTASSPPSELPVMGSHPEDTEMPLPRPRPTARGRKERVVQNMTSGGK